ncbi:MAG: hypothetical protein ACLQDM_32095 [Bradyrhizobium sp.]
MVVPTVSVADDQFLRQCRPGEHGKQSHSADYPELHHVFLPLVSQRSTETSLIRTPRRHQGSIRAGRAAITGAASKEETAGAAPKIPGFVMRCSFLRLSRAIRFTPTTRFDFYSNLPLNRLK